MSKQLTIVALADILGITPAAVARYCRRHGIEVTKVRGPDGRYRNAVTVEDAEDIIDRRRPFSDSPEVIDRLRDRASRPPPWER